MNLRLTEQQDEALTALAEAEGVSKNEAVVRAILDRSARLVRSDEIRSLARETIAEYDDLLRRLGE
ncbi:ribbon-helix-helix protein, CopG family [Salsipaludibacter albus]|uniref:ribbon-helix-helix protein, CopG family n=1 Tax=Salsipaludibacter albus TaxID=2849650 RepID=UPI003B75BFC7